MAPSAYRIKSKCLSLTCNLAQSHIAGLLVPYEASHLLATLTISPRQASLSMSLSPTHPANIYGALIKHQKWARP